MWAEVALASQEQRHELVLEGKEVQERVEKKGLDVNIFKLDKLNFLRISQAKLASLPDTLGCLVNLTSLVLKGNSLTGIPTSLNNLTKLKLLDLSLNSLSSLPPIHNLIELSTLNLYQCLLWGVHGGGHPALPEAVPGGPGQGCGQVEQAGLLVSADLGQLASL